MKQILIYKKSNLIESVGGVEKVLVSLSNSLGSKGYQVHLTTRSQKEGLPFFKLSKHVLFYRFKIKFSSFRRFLGKLGLSFIPYFNRELIVSKIIKNYIKEHNIDVVITAGIQDMFDILYHQNISQKKIVMLHSRPDVYFTKKKKNLFIKTLKQVDEVQVLLPSFVPIIQKYYNGKVVVIGNSVSLNKHQNKREKIIIYPARIEKNKRQHLLIEAFSLIFKDFPDWKIHFRGEAVDNKYFNVLSELVKDKGLQNNVFFLEPTQYLDIEFSKSSICAFPSEYEGFPLGLVESMASSLPCIGFKSASGVSDLIENNQTGFLVENVDDFSQKLSLLMLDPDLRKKMGKNAKESISVYSENVIVEKWENVINA